MSDIELIKSKLNIVDVVREYVPDLKKVGRNWSALSPFRKERTASFIVNEDIGRFKDFGGDKSGDVINFIQEIEHVDFLTALQLCAKKAGIELQDHNQDKSFSKKKNDLLRLNKFASELYKYILLRNDLGYQARTYCDARGLTKEVIEKYSIGYAPKYLKLNNYISKKLGDLEIPLAESGLFVYRGQNLVDKFNDRLMFPVFDNVGQIIGFSGRTILPGDSRPKYINSPETIVFKKSNTLYNLFQGKNEIVENDFAILTEGQIDCISSTNVGIGNIVAPLGTALTVDQLKLISRYTKNLVLCLDNDEAGTKALEKGFILATEANLRVKISLLPKEYKDIDEFVRSQPDEWKSFATKSSDFFEYILKSKTINYEDPYELVRLRDKYFYFLSYLSDKTLISGYITKLSLSLDQERELLEFEFQKFIKSKKVKSHDTTQVKAGNDDLNNLQFDNSNIVKNIDIKEVYLLLVAHQYSFDVDQLKNYFLTVPPDYHKLIKFLRSDENIELSEKVAFLHLPDNIELAKKEFEKLSSYIKLNYKRSKLHDLVKDININETANSEISHELEQVNNILVF
ncbi:DNA primase [bacterium]|nr:MAG: DNA primase [bacterium]